MHDPQAPSDHLLRTLAAVPVSSQILDLGCGEGRHTEPLLRLGFPVHACDPRPAAVEATRARVSELIGADQADTSVRMTPLDALDYPDATFDWVVADGAETYVADEEDLRVLLAESRRLLTPGGWLYLTLPAAPEDGEGAEATFTLDAVERLRRQADLAEAGDPSRVDEGPMPRIRALYRRVAPHTPA
ncbi:MAG: methyltransferase domain-containing protein [Salinibacter sp.]